MTPSLDPTPEVVDYPFNRPDNLELAGEYAAIRQGPGLARVRLPFGEIGWLATRYADARTVLADPRFSRAESVTHDEPRMREGRQTGGILSVDPPDHTRLRVLVAKAFTVKRIEALRPTVKQLCQKLIDDAVADGAPTDIVDRFALPLPVQVICELLGVPTSDRPRFRAWSDAALSTTSMTADEYQASREEFRDYMRGLLAIKRETPTDDLMTALVAARDEGDKLTELELIDLCNGILVAGHETTASQIPNFVLYLLGREGSWRRLHDEPDLIPAAVEELMRLVPLGLGGGQARYATEDVVLGDVTVRAGEPVLVAIAAANRDPEVFDDPETFDLERGRTPHIGFGHGAHHCLGAALARLELQEALLALTRNFPDLAVTEVDWKTEMVVRGPKKMMITW
ncbi:cytochrome P450 [Williamsia phyllosphaerae]|uniref:Cytochrome P450 n=1 Tax=Williamsia phyllosphaerae TaxID=885042 RepID=A0ABQ1V3I6_9NOCA|nr:cytochrome P450 [Williamsia phyllosphaerae]GGF34970.1 cytochrome P450 [Williamsia phyllosphaerae]